MSSSNPLPTLSPAEVEDLLSEILLRLPPQPSSLLRASLICKRARSLVADSAFTRRFRLRHRRDPPLIGCFVKNPNGLYFEPTMEAPNRVPPGRFSSNFEEYSHLLGCRHGLVLLSHASRKEALVWDPVTADQHRIPVPARFRKPDLHGAVLRAAAAAAAAVADLQHFEMVLAVARGKDKLNRQGLLVCVYSSETGVWGDVVSAPLPSTPPTSDLGKVVSLSKPAVLADNCLYWLLAGDSVEILEFDLERKKIAVIQPPVQVFPPLEAFCSNKQAYTVMRAEGGGLGFFLVSKSESGCIAQLWKRMMTHCGGGAFWVLDRTVELDKILSLNTKPIRLSTYILGYAEENNVVFLWTCKGIFMINLESLQFKELPQESLSARNNHPFESVYAAGI